jgi:hypothetical protein
VQVRADDIAISEFTPSDGSPSAAIKVVHRPSGKESVNNATQSQLSNLRGAIVDLLRQLNPSPDQIKAPAMVLLDEVRIHLPESVHEGFIRDLTWDYTAAQWKYFVSCGESRVDNWYVGADLDRLNEP